MGLGFENCEVGFGKKRAGKWDWYPHPTPLQDPPYGIPKETLDALMMLYRNPRSMVRSLDGDVVVQFFSWFRFFN